MSTVHDIIILLLANIGDDIPHIVAFERMKNRMRCFDGSISQ